MREVAIIACGQTRFGLRRDADLRTLALEAAGDALGHARLASTDALWVGIAAAGMANRQHLTAALFANELRLEPHSGGRIECGAASGAAAFRAAWREVAAGLCDTALVVGAEKISDCDASLSAAIDAASLDAQWEGDAGLTPCAAFAMLARRWLERHDGSAAQLAAVARKNRDGGVHNEYAALRRALEPKELRDAAILCDPLRESDAAPRVDGAAAVVLAPLDHPATRAAEYAARVRASAYASGPLRIGDRPDPADWSATRSAGCRAFEAARLDAGAVDVAELHDVFTIAELVASETLGLSARSPDGAVSDAAAPPTNTDGGLLARGDAGGANGVAQLCALTRQLCGRAGPVQVRGARVGLAHSMGGMDATAIVTILEAL